MGIRDSFGRVADSAGLAIPADAGPAAFIGSMVSPSGLFRGVVSGMVWAESVTVVMCGVPAPAVLRAPTEAPGASTPTYAPVKASVAASSRAAVAAPLASTPTRPLRGLMAGTPFSFTPKMYDKRL
ncbi:hypothetical protein C1I98_37790 [Spongiactinospora gelatinilytica]|uniref:Uncharacterized protein n=1 Tax=Spongiactinospora gelatinilytica TaxID=2666298 RepID=A0A2W2E721_9ACTN|nr:hypothetical protein C1I98_37790 [Spongiactinospora gelatinilytica]